MRRNIFVTSNFLVKHSMAPVPKAVVPAQVNGFTVLPLRLPALPSFPKETTHHLYLRANSPKVPTSDTSRELFLVNVPVDATETHLRSLFANQLGGARTDNVVFEGTRVGKGITAPVAPAKKKRKRGGDESVKEALAEEVGKLPDVWDRECHRSGGTAVATFVDKASAELALKEAKKAVKIGKKIVWGAGVEGKVPALGSARYLSHHRLKYPPHAELQASVDAFMTTFAAQEAARAKMMARQRQEPDEDGFVKVVRGGRNDAAQQEAARAREEEMKKRDRKRVGEDFYRFQVREKRKEEAQGLVRGFEEDRRKVEEMRKRRGKVRPE